MFWVKVSKQWVGTVNSGQETEGCLRTPGLDSIRNCSIHNSSWSGQPAVKDFKK